MCEGGDEGVDGRDREGSVVRWRGDEGVVLFPSLICGSSTPAEKHYTLVLDILNKNDLSGPHYLEEN